MYVTIDEIKQHLYIDFEADDAMLADMIQASEDIIQKYLNTTFEDIIDEYGSLPISLKQAIKIMVGNLYANRESVSFNAYPSKIPYSYEYLLQPYKSYKRNEE